MSQLLALQLSRIACGDSGDVTESGDSAVEEAEEVKECETSDNFNCNAREAADCDGARALTSERCESERVSTEDDEERSSSTPLEGACGGVDPDGDTVTSSSDDSSDSFIIDVIAVVNQPAGARDEATECDVTPEAFNEDDVAIRAIACSNTPVSDTCADDDFAINAIASSNVPVAQDFVPDCEAALVDELLALNFQEHLLLTESNVARKLTSSRVDPDSELLKKYAEVLGVTSSTSASSIKLRFDCEESDELVLLARSCSSSSVCLEGTYDATRPLQTEAGEPVVCEEADDVSVLRCEFASGDADAGMLTENQLVDSLSEEGAQHADCAQVVSAASPDVESATRSAITESPKANETGQESATKCVEVKLNKENQRAPADCGSDSTSDHETEPPSQSKSETADKPLFLFESRVASLDMSSTSVSSKEFFEPTLRAFLARSGATLRSLAMSGLDVSDATIRAVADAAPELRKISLVTLVLHYVILHQVLILKNLIQSRWSAHN